MSVKFKMSAAALAEGKRLIAAIAAPGPLRAPGPLADDERDEYEESTTATDGGGHLKPREMTKPESDELRDLALKIRKLERSPERSTAKEMQVTDHKNDLRFRLEYVHGKPFGYCWSDVQAELAPRKDTGRPDLPADIKIT